MKKIVNIIITLCLICSLVGCGKTSNINETGITREFIDSLGRTIQIPEKINKIAMSGPLTQLYVFPLCPELLVGFSIAFSKDAKKYIPEKYRTLPELGQLYGGKGTMNLESLLVASPDIVIDIGEAKEGMVKEFDELTQKTGIPFIHIDATIETSSETYKLLGKLINDNNKSKQLSEWCEKTYKNIQNIMDKVDADGARKSLVYCLGPKGLNVLAEGSYHAEIVSLLSKNVAVVDNVVSNGDGNEVDMEQLMLWDPDVILFHHNSIYDELENDDTWKQLRAIQNNNYYQIPCGPYEWISSPPAVQCFLGMLWLTDKLYPDYTNYDLKSEVKEYYKLFYNYNLSDVDYYELVGNN